MSTVTKKEEIQHLFILSIELIPIIIIRTDTFVLLQKLKGMAVKKVHQPGRRMYVLLAAAGHHNHIFFSRKEEIISERAKMMIYAFRMELSVCTVGYYAAVLMAIKARPYSLSFCTFPT
jgi:hypothetical protein